MLRLYLWVADGIRPCVIIIQAQAGPLQILRRLRAQMHVLAVACLPGSGTSSVCTECARALHEVSSIQITASRRTSRRAPFASASWNVWQADLMSSNCSSHTRMLHRPASNVKSCVRQQVKHHVPGADSLVSKDTPRCPRRHPWGRHCSRTQEKILKLLATPITLLLVPPRMIPACRRN